MTKKHMPEMARRVEATQATADRFKDVPLKFGSRDCARMVAYHLRKMGKKPKGLAKAGSYSTAISAARALRRAGYKNMKEAMDDQDITPIAPAYVVVGDLVELPGEGGLGAIGIALGNGRVLGYHEEAEGAVAVQPVVPIINAWRV